MKKATMLRWPPRRRKGQQSQESALFQGLRVRLTLWYCGVLGTALVLFCVVLYLVAQYMLLTLIQDGTMRDAQGHADRWSTNVSVPTCIQDGGPPGFDHSVGAQQYMLACFDQKGILVQDASTAKLSSAFLNNSLAKTALRDGNASDTAHGTNDSIYRYAVAVHNPSGQGYTGVVVSGISVKQQNEELSLLLALLLTVGGVTLLGAGLGGLFLASRALAPVHLAFIRQQRFIADASHELRTPLTLMRADAEVLLRGRKHMAEEDVALLEDIVAEANHMSTLANSMLMLARLDAETQHHEYEVVSLDTLTRQGAQRVGAFAEQKGVTVTRENVGGAAFVIGDPVLLEQAVLVLLDNAIKYNRVGGQATIRTSIRNRYACVEVVDTGIGIAPEHLSHLGERFYRVEKARSRTTGGTGLGLSIAQRIATSHQGTLTLTSTPQQGTTVTLTLPLATGATDVPDVLLGTGRDTALPATSE